MQVNESYLYEKQSTVYFFRSDHEDTEEEDNTLDMEDMSMSFVFDNRNELQDDNNENYFTEDYDQQETMIYSPITEESYCEDTINDSNLDSVLENIENKFNFENFVDVSEVDIILNENFKLDQELKMELENKIHSLKKYEIMKIKRK